MKIYFATIFLRCKSCRHLRELPLEDKFKFKLNLCDVCDGAPFREIKEFVDGVLFVISDLKGFWTTARSVNVFRLFNLWIFPFSGFLFRRRNKFSNNVQSIFIPSIDIQCRIGNKASIFVVKLRWNSTHGGCKRNFLCYFFGGWIGRTNVLANWYHPFKEFADNFQVFLFWCTRTY